MTRIFLLLLLGLSWSLHAASPVWKVESATSTLYLAGTVHLLRPQDYPLPPAFDVAYSRASRIVLETDIEETQSLYFQRELMASAQLPDATRLQDLLAPETLDHLQQYLQSRGLELASFERFRPIMLSTTLTVLALQRIGVNAEGVDSHFFNRARRDGKATHSLESAQQQIEYLIGMGEGNEDLMIRRTLLELQSLETDFQAMLQAWRSADIDRLGTLFVDPLKQEFTAIYRRLLVERNQKWLPKLRAHLATPETELVLVGSAHLIGDDGLLKLLANDGYRISQMP